jgi:transcriptional regulator with XRE-family HTH domain
MIIKAKLVDTGRLRRAMTRGKIRVQDMARVMGVAPSTLSKYFTNPGTMPKASVDEGLRFLGLKVGS